MSDTKIDSEVEKVLHEMRQNLKAESITRVTPGDEIIREALSQLEGDLYVTARSWNRLPPVVSNRQGWKAQAELWLKRQLKHATRWYSWEQVNFNSATNNALHTLLWICTNYEKQQAALRAEIKELNATVERLQASGD